MYLALAALPLFGVGQFLMRGDPQAWSAAQKYLALYLFSSLSLLVTTSFLGLRRYLRQRTSRHASRCFRCLAGRWIVDHCAILGIAYLAPLPGRALASLELPDFLTSQKDHTASRYGWGDEAAEKKSPGAATTEKDRKPEGKEIEKIRPQEGAPPGDSGDGKGKQGPTGKQKGGQKSASEQSGGDQDSKSKAQQQSSSKGGQQQKSEQQKSEQQKSEQQKSEQQKSEQQKSEQQKSEQQKSEQQKSEQQKSEQQKSEQQKSEQQKSEQQKSEQQKSEQQKSEQQKSEQQKSEQQKSEQQKSEQQKSSSRSPSSRSPSSRSPSSRSPSSRSPSSRSPSSRSPSSRSPSSRSQKPLRRKAPTADRHRVWRTRSVKPCRPSAAC